MENDKKTFSGAKKSLYELEPPNSRNDSPYLQFTADLHRINNFFWSTEISYAAVWNDKSMHQDSTELASTVLQYSNANAFKLRATKFKPHYTAKMGSLLVQLRWNYDALGRYALIEVLSSLEVYIKERLRPILGEQLSSKHLNVIKTELAKKEIFIDPEILLRLWILKEIRNSLVHDRSTIHTFPSPKLADRAEEIMKQSSNWSDDAEWKKRQEAAYNEMVFSTEYRAKEFDLPQLFFIAIYSLTWAGEFAQHLEALLRMSRHRNLKSGKKNAQITRADDK